ncbi:hypothetical protein TKK_0010809 [Trichogramma kaykai]
MGRHGSGSFMVTMTGDEEATTATSATWSSTATSMPAQSTSVNHFGQQLRPTMVSACPPHRRAQLGSVLGSEVFFRAEAIVALLLDVHNAV